MPPLTLKDIQNSPLNRPSESVGVEDIRDVIAGKQPTETQGMKVHIDIRSYDKSGNTMSISADVFTQEDLAAVHEKYREFMPRDDRSILQKLMGRE